MNTIKKCSEKSCIERCEGKCYHCALGILQHNKVNSYVYTDTFRDLFTGGCGKFRNNMIIGQANCGKRFMLKPLQHIYHALCNPANDKCAWVGTDKAEVIVLLDFRWSSELICWNDLPFLLDGKLIKILCPKRQFACDVCIKKDIYFSYK